MPFPNLHIVGAAKSGTTSLWAWLAQHPEVNAPQPKETHWAAADLGLEGESGIRSDEEYLALYEGQPDARWHLDASPSSLYSAVAAQRIQERCPQARVLIALRDPMEVIPSLHEQLALGGQQAHRQLDKALEHAQRHQGAAFSGSGISVWRQYLDVVDYAPQVARYLRAFPAEQIKILWFEDIRDQPKATFAELLHWLDLEAIPIDHRPRNQARHVRSATTQRLLSSASLSPWIRRWVPRSLGRRIKRFIGRFNVVRKQRAPLPPALRKRLAELTRPSVQQLETVLQVNLDHWSRP